MNRVDAMEPSAIDRLHLLLGRLVHAYGRLDLAIGLQLKWLGPYRGVSVEHLLHARLPFKQCFDALKPLVLEMWAHSDVARLQFQSWFERVELARAMRNDFAHGRWGATCDAQEFEFVALSWEMDPAKRAPALRIRLDVFEQDVLQIESLTVEYFRLERRYRMEGRPSKEWENANRPPA